MTKTIRSILFVVLLSCAGIVSAANTALSKQQKIEQMLASLKLDRIIESGISECIESMLNAYYAPEKVVEKSGDYKGMTPKSADWPQVQAAFHRFAEKSCSGAGVERTRKVYIEWYDKNFTEEDLDAIIRFQQSPSGRAFATAQENFTRFLSKATSDANLKAQEEAGVDLGRKLTQYPTGKERANNSFGGCCGSRTPVKLRTRWSDAFPQRVSVAAEADIQEITRTGDIQGLTESPKSGLADEGVCRYFYESCLRRLDVGKCQFRLTTLPIYPALFCQTN